MALGAFEESKKSAGSLEVGALGVSKKSAGNPLELTLGAAGVAIELAFGATGVMVELALGAGGGLLACNCHEIQEVININQGIQTSFANRNHKDLPQINQAEDLILQLESTV